MLTIGNFIQAWEKTTKYFVCLPRIETYWNCEVVEIISPLRFITPFSVLKMLRQAIQ